jgi:arginyl-tRNA synthetase
MGFIVKDETLDMDIVKLQKWLQDAFGIKNCTKTDAIRYLLKMKSQGKKTDINWEKALNDEEE